MGDDVKILNNRMRGDARGTGLLLLVALFVLYFSAAFIYMSFNKDLSKIATYNRGQLSSMAMRDGEIHISSLPNIERHRALLLHELSACVMRSTSWLFDGEKINIKALPKQWTLACLAYQYHFALAEDASRYDVLQGAYDELGITVLLSRKEAVAEIRDIYAFNVVQEDLGFIGRLMGVGSNE
jgi:hypothetical protein